MDLFKMSNIVKFKGEKDPIVNWVDSTLSKNMNLDFVKRMFEKNPKSIPDPENEGYTMTHAMAQSDDLVYPRVVNVSGKMQYLSDKDAYDYAKKTGEYIKFKNADDALRFTENYKKGSKVTIGK